MTQQQIAEAEQMALFLGLLLQGMAKAIGDAALADLDTIWTNADFQACPKKSKYPEIPCSD